MLKSEDGRGTFPTQSKGVGIQLFTITEQKSVPILHAVPSNWTFQRRIVILQQPTSTGALSAQKVGETGVTPRRQCVSLDETAIYKLHHPTGTSEATSAGLLSSTDESIPRPTSHLPRPVQPLFQPPERVKTPEGVPSWRGELAAPTNRSTASASTSGRFLHQLRARGSRVFRNVLGLPAQQVRPQPRTWRPPVSGHTTQRFAALDVHPFAYAPVARPGVPSAEFTGNEQEGFQPENAQAATTDTDRENKSTTLQPVSLSHPGRNAHRTEQSRRHYSLSPSQRALQAASGNAVPVSPQRARLQSEACNAPRSVPMPKHRISSLSSNAPGNGRP